MYTDDSDILQRASPPIRGIGIGSALGYLYKHLVRPVLVQIVCILLFIYHHLPLLPRRSQLPDLKTSPKIVGPPKLPLELFGEITTHCNLSTLLVLFLVSKDVSHEANRRVWRSLSVYQNGFQFGGGSILRENDSSARFSLGWENLLLHTNRAKCIRHLEVDNIRNGMDMVDLFSNCTRLTQLWIRGNGSLWSLIGPPMKTHSVGLEELCFTAEPDKLVAQLLRRLPRLRRLHLVPRANAENHDVYNLAHDIVLLSQDPHFLPSLVALCTPYHNIVQRLVACRPISHVEIWISEEDSAVFNNRYFSNLSFEESVTPITSLVIHDKYQGPHTLSGIFAVARTCPVLRYLGCEIDSEWSAKICFMDFGFELDRECKELKRTSQLENIDIHLVHCPDMIKARPSDPLYYPERITKFDLPRICDPQKYGSASLKQLRIKWSLGIRKEMKSVRWFRDENGGGSDTVSQWEFDKDRKHDLAGIFVSHCVPF